MSVRQTADHSGPGRERDASSLRNDLSVVGDDVEIECADGEQRRYVNLDLAASTPPLQRVHDAVAEFLPWYSSVQRGTGLKSQVSTAALEGARQAVREFVDARPDQEVVLVPNTTHAVNLLAALYPPGTRVLASPAEHHANMLPWRVHDVELLPFTRDPEQLLAATRGALDRAAGAISIVAVTGASNITGEVWPIAELAAIAHEFGAEVFVDAAQLAPHRSISLRSLGVDHLALSGHKLYAPYGAGALVSLRTRLTAAEPPIKGGGAVRFVTLDDVVWADPPDLHEAGSPNTVGAVALGAACDALSAVGMDTIAAHERALAARMRENLAAVPGVTVCSCWPDRACDRVGVATFTVDGFHDRLVARILASEHAIGVRSGRFCAHPLVTRLFGIDEQTAGVIRAEVLAGDRTRLPGAVRASIGVPTREEDVDRLVEAVRSIVEDGPRLRCTYDSESSERLPDDDRRRWPRLAARLAERRDYQHTIGVR